MKKNKMTLMLAILALLACACGSDNSLTDLEKPNLEEKLSFSPNLISDSITWDTAMKELNASNDAKAAFNRWIVNTTTEVMTIPSFSVAELDPNNQSASTENANLIYTLAVRWLFMDKDSENADQYLQKASSLILEWAKVNEPTNHTPRESLLTPIYEAYSIIRAHIGNSDQEEIDRWIKMRANYYKNLSLTGNLLENNWNTIRINFLFYFAQILDDKMLYNYSVNKLKSHIELNILENGISHDFVNRDAFAYHAYNLLFYSRILKATAMYRGKSAAIELYQMKNSKGSSIESCVQYWEPYLIDPENNVHLEFVNTQWAPDKNSGAYNKPYNPGGTVYVLDELRFIESKCSNYIKTITSANRYGRTFKYWINSVEINKD